EQDRLSPAKLLATDLSAAERSRVQERRLTSPMHIGNRGGLAHAALVMMGPEMLLDARKESSNNEIYWEEPHEESQYCETINASTVIAVSAPAAGSGSKGNTCPKKYKDRR